MRSDVPASPQAGTRHRSVGWSKPGSLGAEFALVDLGADWLGAEGFAIGFEPEPYRLEYTLQTTSGFVTSDFVVATTGDGWSRRLELSRGPDGAWVARAAQQGTADLPPAGGDTLGLAGALDVDLGLSPLTNSMPVLRHRLHDADGSADFLMAWISVPDLSVHLSPQRYRHIGRRAADERLVRFEATGEDADFVADIVVDGDGLVVDYPGIGTRVRERQLECGHGIRRLARGSAHVLRGARGGQFEVVLDEPQGRLRGCGAAADAGAHRAARARIRRAEDLPPLP